MGDANAALHRALTRLRRERADAEKASEREGADEETRAAHFWASQTYSHAIQILTEEAKR